MIRYEIKKMFGSVGSKIALFLLAASVVISCWAATASPHGVEHSDDQGQRVTGHTAVVKVRKARKQWAGPLDTERITAAILENQRIEATPQAQSSDYRQTDIAYGWKTGIADIRQVVNQLLSSGFQDYNYYLADSVSISQLPELYENRVRLLKGFLYEPGSNADHLYSEEEKQWLIRQYEALEAPMQYDYFLGWQMAVEYSTTAIMLTALILGYLMAGVFANEFKWKADSIYFSTALGRTASTRAKIQAGFLVITVCYWVCILSYSLYTLIYLGFDGWNCPVQLDRWKCFYNITFLEEYLLILLGGYLGNLFSGFLVMWISAKARSAVVAVTLPFLIVFLPTFLEAFNDTLAGKIRALLPDRLLQIGNAINYFDLYSLGDQVIGAIPVLFVLYCLLSLALVPMMYRQFGKMELS